LLDKGKRVRANKFEHKVIIGNTENTTDHSFDYKTQTHKWKKFVNGDLLDGGSHNLPPGVNFDDILTIFYNFRNSAYGKIQKEKNYTIHTVTQKKTEKIYIHIMNQEEQNEYKANNGPGNREKFLLKAIIPKEIFNTNTGEPFFGVLNISSL